MPYAGSYATFPYSMEWFYMPVNAVMSGPHTFDWRPLDRQLRDIAARGHQAVFRFYLDYPTEPSGIPAYLLKAGLAVHTYTDYDNASSVSPNYDDPRLRTAMVTFIKALGRRYDGDSRIGFVEVGLLGFWGEWHTYPHGDWTPSLTTDDLVLRTFVSAFHRIKLLVRLPVDPLTIFPVGYHDDSFAYSTVANGNGNFMDMLGSYNLLNAWRTEPIGGELRPELQQCIWQTPSCEGPPADYDAAVDATHASWLLNQGVFDRTLPPAEHALALAGDRRLGYELFVTEVLLSGGRADAPITIAVRVRNTGRAPFYYAWPAELALARGGRVAATWQTNWHIETILPGQPDVQLTSTPATPHVAAGRYDVVLRVANPMPGGPPLRFANRTQDATLPGWLTLGTLTMA